MSQSKVEKVVLELQQTVMSLVKKVESLQSQVRDQTETIKSQSELLAKLTQGTPDVNLPTPTRNVPTISVTAATKQRPPARAASVRAISTITTDVRKKREARGVSPLLIPPVNTGRASDIIPVATTSSTVTPEPTEMSETANETSVNIIEDNNKWTTVQRKRSRVPKNVIKGTAEPGKTSLEASERWKYYHLYYVKSGTTDQMIIDHLTSICKENVCTVESLKPKGNNYASFKLGVPAKFSELVVSADNWPADICLKPWRNLFRNQNNKE